MSPINHELQLANDFVQHTDCNIFLTGKAGTGKTTFLHNLHKNTVKRMIITAPTGESEGSSEGSSLLLGSSEGSSLLLTLINFEQGSTVDLTPFMFDPIYVRLDNHIKG